MHHFKLSLNDKFKLHELLTTQIFQLETLIKLKHQERFGCRYYTFDHYMNYSSCLYIYIIQASHDNLQTKIIQLCDCHGVLILWKPQISSSIGTLFSKELKIIYECGQLFTYCSTHIPKSIKESGNKGNNFTNSYGHKLLKNDFSYK